MPIITVNTNQLIGVAKYNEIQTTASMVLSYYGVIPESVPISSGTTNVISTSSTWGPLWNDINKCVVHQTGSAIPAAKPTTSVTASAFSTNQFIDAINLAFITTSTASASTTVTPTNQLTLFSNTSIRTSNFGTTGAIHHTVEYEWVDAASMTRFLNTNGYLAADLAWSNAGTALDSDLIDILGSTYSALHTDTFRVYVGNPTPANCTYTKGAHTITVTFTRTSSKKYTLDISILSTSVQTLAGSSITGTTRCYTSTDATGGIPGPTPQATTTVTFEGSATAPTSTKALSANALTSFSFYTGDAQSASQTITLTNNGNTQVTISSINYTRTGGVVEYPTYSWAGGGTSTLIAPNGGTRTITLAYSGTTGGTFNNSVTVINDSNQPRLTIPTTQIITGFDLNPVPSSLNPTVSTLTPYTQQFVIIRSNVSPVLSSSYTASVTGAGFYAINSNTGPTLVFDPSGKNNGSYSATITVTMGGYSVSKSVALTLNIPTQNLGSWKSGTAYDNAVVGMSYDIIGGTRYLTIGVGMGNDGSSIISANGSSSANATYLRYDADSDPAKGMPLYEYVGGDRAWTPFLKGNAETGGEGYGVTYRYHVTIPVTSSLVKRSYTFSTQAGTHSFNYAVDDNGYVEISNPNTGGFDVVFDGRTQIKATNYNRINQGTWNAPITGSYIVNLYSQNTGFPGAVAFRLINSATGLDVWSTRDPVRAAYLNWAEVYRIPLNQGAYTYRTGELNPTNNMYKYLVKDSCMTNSDGKPYGAFFEGQSMFSVTDTGEGNLAITFNPVGKTLPTDLTDQNTIYNITALPYYVAGGQRYTNLPNGSLPTGSTYRFDGFDNAGGVITSVHNTPGDPVPPAPPVDYGGGGGGGEA
jgi:hypothetical protein